MKVGGVTRWHMIRMRAPQSLAEHSYNVCMLARKMMDTLHLYRNDQDRLALMDYALCHDAHEIEHGDVPSPSEVGGGTYARGAFWTARGGLSFPPAHIVKIVRLMDRVEAYIHYTHHGCNGRQGSISIKDYLHGRVMGELRDWDKEVQDYVNALIEEVGPMYCNKPQDWR
jgi:hypothetical protein